MHVTMGLFEVNETIIQKSMVVQLHILLDRFGLLHLIIAFVKYEGMILFALVIVLHSIFNYEPLNIFRVYEGTCSGHVMSKVC